MDGMHQEADRLVWFSQYLPCFGFSGCDMKILNIALPTVVHEAAKSAPCGSFLESWSPSSAPLGSTAESQ